MRHLPVVSAMLENAFDEIYVVDCATLHLLDFSQSALANLRYDRATLAGMRLPDLTADLTLDIYNALLCPLDTNGVNAARLDVCHQRGDGSSYPLALRISRVDDGTGPVYFVIGQDLTEQQETARLLRLSEARFSAIVSNTPGLVYQFVLQENGAVSFPYLSEGCHALLGIGADQLQADAARFVAMILPEDRPSYLSAMNISSRTKKTWNWVGRIWIEQWRDTKWINLRAMPRALPNRGGVQWEGIMTNITQSKLVEAEIKRSRAQLAELSAHLNTVKEQERTRIARDIHDDLGGNLTAIKMSLAVLARRLPPETQLCDKAEYLDSLVDRTIESVHRIAGNLRPGVLDFGLVAAIDWQAQEFEKQSGIACLFESSQNEIALDPDQAIALFRIFQEALTNISKHAQASQVHVSLMRRNRSVHLQVSDNGRGIVVTDRLKAKSFGIRGMAERASALGGELLVCAGPEGGCVVSVKVPVAGGGVRNPGSARSARKKTTAIPALQVVHDTGCLLRPEHNDEV